MSLRKRLRKRARRLLPSDLGPVRLAQWDAQDCRGCGLPVLFQPWQRSNVCGWCDRQVTRGLG